MEGGDPHYKDVNLGTAHVRTHRSLLEKQLLDNISHHPQEGTRLQPQNCNLFIAHTPAPNFNNARNVGMVVRTSILKIPASHNYAGPSLWAPDIHIITGTATVKQRHQL